MRGNEFLDKLESIDPAYVEEADEQPKRKRPAWLKWGGLAACVCVVAAAALAPVVFRHQLKSLHAPHRVETPPDPPGTERTSDAYESLEELLDDLSRRGGRNGSKEDSAASRPKLVGREGTTPDSTWQTGRDTVSCDGVVYQIIDGDPLYNEKLVGVFRDGVQTGTVELSTPPEILFVTDGKLIVVGRRQSSTELDPDPEDYGVAINIYGLDDPERPAIEDTFHQRGARSACWVADGRLWLITLDGVDDCGWSRLDDIDDYKPQIARNGQVIPWPDEDIRILGEPTQMKYAAVSCIDLGSREVVGKRACYGDISDVYFGPDWFALVTSSLHSERSYVLPEVYTFDGALAYTGKCDTAAQFGLKKTAQLSLLHPQLAEYPEVKAVSRAGDVWRILGEYQKSDGESWSRELFAITFHSRTGQTAVAAAALPEAKFSIDDVLWEDDRAIISAGFDLFSDEFDLLDQGVRLVFAEFDGMAVSLLPSDLICDRAQGVDGIYWFGSPLGQLKPFIPLGDGLYLRYNGVPDGLDLYDLSDSADPRCLYRSPGDIPEGCRLDFENYVIGADTVAVKFIPGTTGYYSHELVCTWALFSIDPDSDTPVSMWGRQLPLTGTDPAGIELETTCD